MDNLSINVVERLGMVVSLFVLVSSCADRPSVTKDCALLRGDNEAAVHWVRRCRGGLEPRSSALMRLLGVLEVSSGWHFEATYVRGIHNAAADGISRWDRGSVLDNLRVIRPNIPRRRFRNWGPSAFLPIRRCWLRTHATRPLWPRLNELIWGILEHG